MVVTIVSDTEPNGIFIMAELDRLILMAEDELTQYSTDARKIEKLRRKIGLSVSRAEQLQIKAELEANQPSDPISQLVLNQRQAVALPFWGIAGLGLLLGISLLQPWDFLATFAGGALAIAVQRWGWRLEARKLVLDTLEDIDQRLQNPSKD
jgi:hypothetical protein